MKSSRRLQHIFRIIKKYHSEVVHSKASTLFINYLETFDLQNIDLPNIYNYTTLKKQQIDAQILGLKTLDDKKKYDLVITSIPKSREEALGQIALAYQQTKIGGILVLEGRKRNGIESIIKVLLNKLRIHQLISKAHGKFAVIKVEFETINIISKWLTYTIPAKNKDGFYSMPGLFSYKTIDPASQFLTSTFNNQLEGHVIDLGAGWGVLSSELLKKSTNIKSITLMDHDLRAIACAKKNISNPKAKFKWMDINEINNFKFKFDYAISNPPFHSNKGRNIDLGKSFIIAAHKVLKPRGHFFLVANIQLPYENIIDSLFDSFKIQSQNKYFKIILAKKPKRHYDISDVTI